MTNYATISILLDIGSFEPAKFSPLVLLKPMTCAVTVGVSDRPGVHDASVTFVVATRIATTRQYWRRVYACIPVRNDKTRKSI